ncbi:MAG TPA: pseudouridine synthase [Flavobacterium sp.]|nr:pseudouridine synthase [Flavobacterium sp.]
MNHISNLPDCFIPFKSTISTIELPVKMNYPFYSEVHPLCKIAVKEVQDYLEKNTNLPHNFGLDLKEDQLAIGKMFGILIVEYNGTIGYLAAYSGKLANSNNVAFFVPPVFDMLQKDSYFLQKEIGLNEINHQIEALEKDVIYISLKELLQQHIKSSQLEIDQLKIENKNKKQFRKQQRLEQKTFLNDTNFEALEATLIKESLYDKHLLNTLIENIQNIENQLVEEINVFKNKIDFLKEKRKVESNALQQWLFKAYTFLNANNQEKSLLDIFQTALHAQPPAGAGECCAPKLFQYAYKNGLKPLALAEFWWGQSPKSEVRKHKQFYPSCWGKCEPILGHMLQGLQVDDNPFLNNPAEGKELPILYDDPYLVVVNKPAEFLSVPGIHISDSVYERIKTRYPQATGPLIVHRLDMSTSGVMVLAKNKEVHENIQKQFIKRKVKKSYIALLEGEISEKEGIIELPLRVNLEDRPRQLVCFDYGKMAITEFKVLAVENNFTRIQYVPITGRTHQLRVHSAHKLGLNAPIKGDDLYGNRSQRLYLHAHTLSFFHPVTKQWITFEANPDF